ncbi:NUDIX domain-containing protein [Streptomyces sp. NBC_01239]|uniref:NUDIX domain-containing protein n=1 Tax=Streptomyces sp. NBC_01239 TaxID=2903792 RepID=UPI00225358C6|nr:NUDIX domain-containing protein [Streptomyces sp. NBC_01239]MCX4809088.1 NUDIX domain-containing protein [Streptomyces sp. NBC_01239]
MIEESARGSRAELLDVHRLRLVETAAPRLTPEERFAMNRVWDAKVRANPSFFDGPVLVCAGARREVPDELTVSWVRTTYRHFALRRVPFATSWLPSFFVSVLQPTDDGRLLVGRMSNSTAAPGRWQLPGGSLEPPEGDAPLDLAALHRHAARELIEETGVDTRPDDLTLWNVARAGNGGIGVLFRAPSLPEARLRERFEAMAAAERAQGREPELDDIALIHSTAQLPLLTGPHADYLEPIVRRYEEAAAERA